jgi:hypothetical protein
MTKHARIEVGSEELFAALTFLAAAKGGVYIQLTFDRGQLEIRRGSAMTRVPARGKWSGTAKTSATLAKELLRRRKALPEMIEIVGAEHSLHISHYSTPCSWRGLAG